MSRPPFAVSDAQAKALLLATTPLLDLHPLNQHNHRQFVGAFVRAVHRVTGKTHGPVVYRRLLAAYAPGRRPSTATLEREKALLEQELRLRPMAATDAAMDAPMAAAADVPRVAPDASTRSVLDGVKRTLEEFLPSILRLAAASNEEQHATHFAYLRQRMEQIERATAAVRDEAAQLAAQLQEAQGAVNLYREQLVSCQAALAAHAAAAATLADEQTEQRKFALMSIEGARGEARELKDVCRHLNAELARRDIELDALRRRDYRQAVDANPVPGRPG